jgi:aminopeptidase N
MEHQTMTSILPTLVTGDHSSDDTFAHELSHQWFGNSLSVADWAEMWLNEGFASYIEALYIQYKYGDERFKQKMQTFRGRYFNEAASVQYPLSDPPWDYIFGRTIYYKGAWVLYMLHTVLGDDIFWQVMPTWAEKYAYSNVTIENFQAVCEEIAGEDLEWFFNQWVERVGYPKFVFSTYIKEIANGKFRVDVSAVQTQDDVPSFRVPVEIAIYSDHFDTTAVFWMDAKADNFTVIVPEKPQSIFWDPDAKILSTARNEPGYTRPVLIVDKIIIDDSDTDHNRVIGQDETAFV